jgi:hypothetical protein
MPGVYFFKTLIKRFSEQPNLVLIARSQLPVESRSHGAEHFPIPIAASLRIKNFKRKQIVQIEKGYGRVLDQ